MSLITEKAALVMECTTKAGELNAELGKNVSDSPQSRARFAILPKVIVFLRKKAIFHLVEMCQAVFKDERDPKDGAATSDGSVAALELSRQEMLTAHKELMTAMTADQRLAISDILGLLEVES